MRRIFVARLQNYYDTSLASHSCTVLFLFGGQIYFLNDVEVWFAVQVSPAAAGTLMNIDYMFVTK